MDSGWTKIEEHRDPLCMRNTKAGLHGGRRESRCRLQGIPGGEDRIDVFDERAPGWVERLLLACPAHPYEDMPAASSTKTIEVVVRLRGGTTTLSRSTPSASALCEPVHHRSLADDAEGLCMHTQPRGKHEKIAGSSSFDEDIARHLMLLRA